MLICLVLQIIGWFAIWKQKKRPGLVLIGTGTAILFVGGLAGLTHEVRRTQEYAFAPLDTSSVESGEFVVTVLGTGFNPDSELPANSQVSGVFLSRLLEGTRICQALPKSTMLVSVAGTARTEVKAAFLAQISQLLRIDQDRLSLISDASSTLDEAESTARLVDHTNIIVVTSASHMKRAMMIFRSVGLDPIAAPTSYNFVRHGSPNDRVLPLWIPSTTGADSSQQWLYEFSALLWHRLTVQ